MVLPPTVTVIVTFLPLSFFASDLPLLFSLSFRIFTAPPAGSVT